jgi:hypothetical protein
MVACKFPFSMLMGNACRQGHATNNLEVQVIIVAEDAIEFRIQFIKITFKEIVPFSGIPLIDRKMNDFGFGLYPGRHRQFPLSISQFNLK